MARPKEAQPYRVICISMYNEDLAELDRKVETLKKQGKTHANRSSLIRHALAGTDLEAFPKKRP